MFSDLNSTEHVWDALERYLLAQLHLPENTQQVKQMLIEEWAFFQLLFDNQVLRDGDKQKQPSQLGEITYFT